MKPSAYYRNEKERLELLHRIPDFKFTNPEEKSRFIALIAGREGSGKTHLACTMSERGPVYLIDTEYRAQVVVRKFPNVKFAQASSYREIVVAVQYIIQNEAPGTIVIDSGSDLQTFAEIEYLERTEKEKVGMPWNWSEVWRLCNAIIDEIKFSGKFDIVITSRLKEEYVNDKGTGQMVPRIYSTLPYKADVVIQFSTDKTKRPVLTKNGFSRGLSIAIQEDTSLPQIIDTLSHPEPLAGKSPAAGRGDEPEGRITLQPIINRNGGRRL